MNTVVDAALKLERDVHVEPSFSMQRTYGSGTKSDPFRAMGGHIDQTLMHRIGLSARIYLAEAEYVTNGVVLPPEVILIGAGQDKTVIRLAKDAQSLRYPHLRMLTDGNWNKLCVVRDLTLDGNWKNQITVHDPSKIYYGNFKIEPLSVKTLVGKYERVRVINAGSSGGSYGDQGLEAFPLSFNSISTGPPFQYHPLFKDLIGKEPTTWLEIVDCEVKDMHYGLGGTCTAIFVETNFPGNRTVNGEDRQKIGLRETPAAIIKGNRVSVGPHGIAYGCAHTEKTVFENNIATNGACGFNIDTGPAVELIIRNNQFLNLNQGINFTPAPGSSRLDISRNVFLMTEPYWNDILKVFQEFYAVKVRNTQSAQAVHNWVVAPSGCIGFDGLIPSSTNIRIDRTGVGTGPEQLAQMAALETQLKDSNYKVSILEAQFKQCQTFSAELKESLSLSERMLAQERSYTANLRDGVAKCVASFQTLLK